VRRRGLAALTLTAALLSGAACSGGVEAGGNTGSYDCDAGDRRQRDSDCGRYVNGKWQEWSWVKAGKTKPPKGWKPAKETASTGGGSKTTTTDKKKTTTGGGAKSGTNRSRTTRRR
jgi:hypothetical protein